MNKALRLLPLLLLGCNEAKSPGTHTGSELVDADNDGFSSEVDCDDGSAAVHPDADELCDGIDNNCDGAIDEDAATSAATWFLDADADGFGDPDSSLPACAAPAGHVANSTDCDDAGAAIHPDADELCDGVDNNCDGVTDEDTATDAATWFLDGDGDGFGDPDSSLNSCSIPTGYVTNNTDCNDADQSTYPGAPELCVDGIDTDCDGLADEDDTDACRVFSGWAAPYSDLDAVADITITGSGSTELATEIGTADVDGDGIQDVLLSGGGAQGVYLFLGSTILSGGHELRVDDADYFFSGASSYVAVAGAGDIDGDGLEEVLIGDYTATVGDHNFAGITYLFFGSSLASDREIPLSDADYTILGEEEYGYLGQGITSAGDVDGDGFEDIIIGESGINGLAGATRLFLASSLGFDDTRLASDADYSFMGVDAGDWSGWFLSPAGDVDGDELDDFLVGTWTAGSAYLVFGGSLGSTAEISLADADYTFVGDELGSVAGVGDVDNDGLDDLMFGEVGNDEVHPNGGAVHLFLGAGLGTETTLSGTDADHSFYGGVEGAKLGESVAPLGDIDNDGRNDLLFAAWSHTETANYSSRPGTVYVVLAASLGSTTAHSVLDADHIIHGESGMQAAMSYSVGLLGAGDIDGDDQDDLLIGTFSANRAGLFLANDLSSTETDFAAASQTFLGEDGLTGMGGDLDFIGDIDGDGRDDILIGAEAGSPGAACLFLSASIADDATALTEAEAAYCFYGVGYGNHPGHAVSGAGDVDGDGLPDLLIAAYGDADHADMRGVVYLILSSSLGSERTISLDDADYTFVGEAANDFAGGAVDSAGDVDGDGLDDILIAAYRSSALETAGGSVYLIYASSLGTESVIDLADADVRIDGTIGLNLGGYFHQNIAGGGDFDGDGLADLLLGSHNGSYSDVGSTYVVLGSTIASGSAFVIPDDTDLLIDGSVIGGDSGYAVAWMDDMDGDGLSEILMGAGGWNNEQAWLFFSTTIDGATTLTTDDADYSFSGDEAGNGRAGSSVADAGDVDGDGIPDILFGAWLNSDEASQAGQAYLFLGGQLSGTTELLFTDADYRFYGSVAGSRIGEGLAANGDFNGDGLSDLLVGSNGSLLSNTVHMLMAP